MQAMTDFLHRVQRTKTCSCTNTSLGISISNFPKTSVFSIQNSHQEYVHQISRLEHEMILIPSEPHCSPIHGHFLGSLFFSSLQKFGNMTAGSWADLIKDLVSMDEFDLTACILRRQKEIWVENPRFLQKLILFSSLVITKGKTPVANMLFRAPTNPSPKPPTRQEKKKEGDYHGLSFSDVKD